MVAALVESDPNWLLSSTAQSAAALVAIVGGFLAGRLLALSADKSAAERRLRTTSVALESAESEESVASSALHRWQQDRDEREKTEIEQYEREVAEVQRDLSSGTRQWAAMPLPPLRSLTEVQEERDLVERATDASWRVRHLTAERDQIARELASLQVPADLKRGFRVLVVFALLGVVLPIVIMATQPVTVSPFIRLLVVLSFVLGFGWLVVFIFGLIAAAESRKPSAKTGAE